MSTPLDVLIVEDSEDDALLLMQELRRGSYNPTFERVDTFEAMSAALAEQTWDIIIADYSMPDFSAPAALKLLQESGRDLPFIIVSGAIGEDTAVATMKAGAHDYVMKDNLVRLNPVIQRELQEAMERREHKRAEEEIRRLNAELEQANRLRSEFMGAMSHELRSPLNIIIGYNSLLIDGVFGSLTQEQVDILQRVDQSSRELLDLINTTLDLSRLEAGRMPLELQEVSVSDLIDQVYTEIRSLHERPDLNFEKKMAADLPSLRTDPTKLKVVLKNLIGNAVKFTEKGSLTVEVCGHNGGTEISVTDTGMGIAPEALPIIFEPFRQAHSSTMRSHSGAGLGLYIVRRLLELLGGTITVESQVGHGSTFRVWVPNGESR
jgi:two-component system sensor histidine kinase EvgS